MAGVPRLHLSFLPSAPSGWAIPRSQALRVATGCYRLNLLVLLVVVPALPDEAGDGFIEAGAPCVATAFYGSRSSRSLS
jgi:hypothetical protein